MIPTATPPEMNPDRQPTRTLPENMLVSVLRTTPAGLKRLCSAASVIILLLLTLALSSMILSGHGPINPILIPVAFALALAPWLLPAIHFHDLSRASIALFRKGATVRHPEAIRAFGRMDILCTGTTGILTRNEPDLVRHLDTGGEDSEDILRLSYIYSVFTSGRVSPLDEIVRCFRYIDIDDYRKIGEIPAGPAHCRQSVVVAAKTGHLLIARGTPEELLPACLSSDRERIAVLCREKNADGIRTLAICYRTVPDGQAEFSAADEKELMFAGLVTYLDLPDERAGESARLLARSGIALKILTGDNELLARKTCEQAGIGVAGMLTAPEIERLDHETLARRVEETTLFTGLTPSVKERVIEALQQNGHVVGYIGDDTGDVPAIRHADASITGRDAAPDAKESSGIILAGNALQVLNGAVPEARQALGRTMQYILAITDP